MRETMARPERFELPTLGFEVADHFSQNLGSERKTEDDQQVVTNADQLLVPSLSTLSSRFATICHT
jgi:hypothetical protein